MSLRDNLGCSICSLRLGLRVTTRLRLSLRCQPLFDELQRSCVGFGDFLGVAVAEAVFGAFEGEEFVLHAVLGQFASHVGRAEVRDVGVLGAVDHQDRRVVARDLFDRAEAVELAGFFLRVMPVTPSDQPPVWRRWR